MAPDATDDLILRHLDGESSPDDVAQVTRLLAGNPQFRSRFRAFVAQAARLHEILDNRLHDPPTTGEVAMSAPTSAPARPRPGSRPDMAPPAAPSREWNLDFRRVYFNALLGGAGGLLGWLVISLLGSFVSLDGLNVYVRDAIIGPLLGLCMGFAVGSTEGLVGSRSLRRVFLGGRYGAALGALGGVLGLVLGELIFNLAGGGVWPRALGWAFFGIFVGASEGVAHRMTAKIRYGVLGGFLGGLIGGSTYEGLVAVLRGSGDRTSALAWGSAVGLILVGACIGFLVSLVETLLRKAWVMFLTGRLEGQTRTLDSSRAHTIGSDASCTIVVPNDASIAPLHAEIAFSDGEFRVRPLSGQVVVRRDGYDQAVTSAQVLCPGDRVLVGDARMIFRNVEGRKS